MKRLDTTELWRMAHWAFIGAALLWLAFGFDLQETYPGLQAVIYHAANVTLRAWIGYWIDRNLLGKIDMDIRNIATVHEAIVFGARILCRAGIVVGVVMTSK